MGLKIKNNATTTLSAAITSSDTSISVVDISVFPTISLNDYFYLTIVDVIPATKTEIVKVIDISGSTLIVERGQENTTAQDFDSGAIIEQRATTQTLTELSTFAQERLYLDEIILSVINRTMFSYGEFTNRMKKDAPRLLSEWNTKYGQYLRVQIENKTTGKIYDNLMFSTLSEMHTWAINNITADGSNTALEHCIAKPYEIVNPSIPAPTKTYMFNRFFHALRGKRKYKSGSNSTAIESHSTMDSIILTMLQNCLDSNCTLEKEALWLSAATKNLYGDLPLLVSSNPYVVTDIPGNSRLYWDTNTKTYNYVPNTDDEYYNIMDPGGITYVFMTGNASGVNMVYYMDQLSFIDNMATGNSGVIAIKLADKYHNERIALQVKPIGIDTIVLELPDFNKYHFEIVYSNNLKQSYIKTKTFSNTSDFLHTDFDTNGGKMRMKSSEWLQYGPMEFMTQHSNWNDLKWDNVRFRLRDKITGEVSNLSTTGIIVDNKNKILIRKMLPKIFK